MFPMRGHVRKDEELSPFQHGAEADHLRLGYLVQPAHQEEDQSLPDEAEVSPQVPAAD